MNAPIMLSRLLPDLVLPHDVAVSGLTMDSREVAAGDAFVAIAGFGTHGLAFADHAATRGASVILFDPAALENHAPPTHGIAVPNLRARLGAMANVFYGAPSQAMTMVGVTGTNGKTSFVQLLSQAWHMLGMRSGSIGTLGAGLYGQVRATGFTTPLVLSTHRLLAELHAQGAQAVAMEASSHALDQGRVDGVHFDVGVFTNLTRDHLDYHGDMARYGAAKARLFTRPETGRAVINLDDAFGAELFADARLSIDRLGVSSHGHPEARLRAEDVRLDASGLRFELTLTGPLGGMRTSGRAGVYSPLLGRFNVDNLLAVAATLLLTQDIGMDALAGLLSRLQPIAGRMNRLGGDGAQPLVVVDYAHTPDALDQALTSLRDHVGGRLVCVFGCGGDRDRGKRPQMAAIAERLADRVFVTDDNPRSENGDAIVADVMAGFVQPQTVTVQRDRARAIADAIAQAGSGDIVLVAGKGHESYQEIGGVRHPFDDTVVARQVLEARA